METTYWRIKRENINLKCERDKLRLELEENRKLSNTYFVNFLIIIVGLTIALFIF